MSGLLPGFEHDERGRVPAPVAAGAGAVEAAGTGLRLRSLDVARWRDLERADATAFGIDGRGAELPAQAGQWLDALGPGGWRHLRDKPGCVFARRARADGSSRVVG